MENVMLKKLKHKWALVVGCDYPNDSWHLTGCHKDAVGMRKILLERFGFHPDSIKVFIDTPGNPKMPTAARIKSELYSMIHKAKSGDALLFYFAGHGTDSPKNSPLKYEAIVASDDNLITSGLIYSRAQLQLQLGCASCNGFDFRDMVNRVPKGASFTIMADSCSSGGLIDKEPVQIGPHHPKLASTSNQLEDEVDVDDMEIAAVSSHNVKHRKIPHEALLQAVSNQTRLNNADMRVHMLHLFGSDASLLYTLPHHRLPKPLKADQGILLSGCQPDENSADSNHGGLFTIAFKKIVHKIPPANLSNRKIILMARSILELKNWNDPEAKQHPCLYCSKKNAYAIFLANP